MALATLSIDLTARMATLERDMGRAAQITQKSADRMQKAFDGVGTALAGLGGLLGVGTFGVWIRGAVDAAAQVERLSQLSGAGAVEFQRYAAGSKSVGIETEKLADIFKDVNDKVGEFILTGGGELKDFFETIAPKVGVTAEQFRNLSGPQALQLYFNSLQKANVSQAEMTFFMEAIADEASALAPLLKNNGEGIKEFADEADRLGGIYSEQLVKESKAFNENLDKLQFLSQGVAAQLGNAMIPSINSLMEKMQEAIPVFINFGKFLGESVAKAIHGPADAIERIDMQIAPLKERLAAIDKELEKPRLLRIDPISSTSELAREALEIRLQLAELERSRASLANMANNPPPAPGNPKGDGTFTGTFRPDEPAAKPEKSSARTKADDLLGDFAKDADERLKPYFDAMQKFEQIQSDAIASTADLTQSEKAFFDLINAPEWQAMSASLQDKIRASFEAANATERLTESEKRLHDLLNDSVLEGQREDMRLLADAYLKGAINAEQYGDAVQRALGNVADPVKDAKDQFADLKRAIEGWGQDSAQAIVDFAITGKSSFSDMIESMLADLAKMMIYKNVTGPMAAAVSNFFAPGSGSVAANALGGVYDSPSLSAYSNQVHSTPKFFQFANGGVFAEAGPEAIMPLSRDSRGRLGVKAEGGGTAVNIEIINNSGAQVQQREVADSRGGRKMQIVIGEAVASEMRRPGSAMHSAARQTFGLTPVLSGR